MTSSRLGRPDWLAVAGGIEGDEPPRHREGDDPEGDVDDEYPAPAGIRGDQAAEERRQHRGDQGGPGQQRDGLDEVGFGCRREHDQPADRHHHRRADPLHHPQRHQLTQVRGQGASGRGHGEDDDRGEEDPAGSEAVGQPATQRNQHGEGQQVGGDDDRDGFGRDPEVAPHPRRGRGDDRAVEELHEEAPGDQQCGGPVAALGGSHAGRGVHWVNSRRRRSRWQRCG
jgi:hypothetical protein